MATVEATRGLTREQRAYRIRIFAIAWLAYAGFYLCRKNLSVSMPFLKESLGYTKDDFAGVIFGYNLFYMLGQFGNGTLADRLGPRLMVGVGLLTAACATALSAITATMMRQAHRHPGWAFAVSGLD